MKLGMLGIAAMIAAAVTTGCSDTTTGPGTTPSPAILKITNKLLRPVVINANGKEVMTVEALSTKQVSLGKLDTLKIDWDLVNTTMPGGAQVGDEVGGKFTTKQNPSGTTSLTIDNVVGSYKLFLPYITNNTGSPLEMVVNVGLDDENKCDCSIASNGEKTELGYYWLYGSTIIRGYKSGSNYSGEYVNWIYGQQFTGSDLEYTTGRLELTASAIGAANPVEPSTNTTSRTRSTDRKDEGE